ncbi:NAD(P)-binding protein [Daldinia caldariorum]|uniref:NAD(P)-binding protein n=1 Tax=Daldinia caldariorum TaxID=326644 RepID=UPI0020072024|nr:NAD(P)-binding protein [Daldinia caldariorum]KAI1472189.1 NAD(P)-binding protein [Daldinia caldariorum]
MASDKKIVLITGGNTGLGFEIAKALYQSEIPYEIIIGARTVSKGEDAIATLRKEYPQSASSLSVVQADLDSDASLEKAVETISSQYGRLDALVNNAGASFDNLIQEGKMTLRQGFNATWDLNVSGTHVLTSLAVPLLLKSSDPRVLFITSGTSTLSETEHVNLIRLNASPPAGWPKPKAVISATAYRSSKTGLNMLMREWHRILKNDGVKVWAISPGFLATGLAGVGPEKLKQMGALDPSVGGQFVRDVLQGKRDEDAGKVVRSSGIQPW